MKRRNYLQATIIILFCLLTSTISWGETVTFELTVSNLSITIENISQIGSPLIRSYMNGRAGIAGWAGSPMEEVRNNLRYGFYESAIYTMSNSYVGGIWLNEMSVLGTYDPNTCLTNTTAKIVSSAPNPGGNNPFGRASFVTQMALISYTQNFDPVAPGNGYNIHISGNLSYNISKNFEGQNFFTETNWSPVLNIGFYIPWVPGHNTYTNFELYELFADKSIGTHTSTIDYFSGEPIYDIQSMVVSIGIFTQNFGDFPEGAVPLPGTLLFLGTGVACLSLYRHRKQTLQH